MTPVATPGRPDTETAPRLHPSAQLGLLRYLTDSALDGDYELVARRPGGGGRWGRRGLAAALIAALFGYLIIMSAGQTSRSEAAGEADRSQLIDQLRGGREALETKQVRAQGLQREVASLRTQVLGSSALSARTRGELTRLGLAAGTTSARGEGVIVTVDDADEATDDRQRVLDMDLQRLVNGLWEAGAEAISINGHRLGPLSAIRQAGVAITVNYRSLQRPYVLRVIGDQGALPGRFAETASGRAWLDLQQRVNLQLDIRTSDRVTLPALPTKPLRYATNVKEASR